jgi:hypothetical protein
MTLKKTVNIWLLTFALASGIFWIGGHQIYAR